MSKKRYFLKQFFKQKKTVGAISPSSKFLAKKMLSKIDDKKHKVFVEFGPGTGVFTRSILKKIGDDSKLLLFELHDPFYQKLKKEFGNDGRVILINDSAETLNKHLQNNNLTQVDFVISSLPLANFKPRLVYKILTATYTALRKGGYYVQFQYSLKSKKKIEKVFNDIDLNFTSRNLPPAFVYTAKK